MEGKYRTTMWIDTNTLKTWHGLWFVPKGKRKGMPVLENGKPVFFNTEIEAMARADELNRVVPADVVEKRAVGGE